MSFYSQEADQRVKGTGPIQGDDNRLRRAKSFNERASIPKCALLYLPVAESPLSLDHCNDLWLAEIDL